MKKRAKIPPAEPAPDHAAEARLEFGRAALADLLAHASEFPDVEVCGVLVGAFQEDPKTQGVIVEGIIRGEGARERGAAVTFTNETWNHIHEAMDKRWEGRKIVGWYHTHPDFDVFLSDMDTFIHTNFFSHPSQVAVVRDPIRGLTAAFIPKGGTLVPLQNYWLDGKAVPLAMPGGPETEAGPAHLKEELQDLRRLLVSIQTTVDGLSRSQASNWTIAFLLALLVALMGGQFYQAWRTSKRAQEYFQKMEGAMPPVQMAPADVPPGPPGGMPPETAPQPGGHP